jgi:glycosyltransferase involved in cell wall biosynthesis
MPEKPPIILLSNVRWDALWEYSHALATLFANAGYPTVFVETTGMRNPPLGKATGRRVLKRLLNVRSDGKKPASLSPNLTVYSPLLVPPTNGVFRFINHRLFLSKIVRDLRRLISTAPVVIAFAPTQTTLSLVSGLEPRLAWYHCTLNYAEIPDAPVDVKETERQLLRVVDIATVDSGFLKEKHHGMRPDMIHIEGGVDFDLFRQADTGHLRFPAKVLYYFGRAYDRVFDFELVQEVTQAGFTVRLLGTLSEPSFTRTPGVEFLGEVQHEALPGHLREADVLIIPYKITPFTQGTFPAKTYEALATGKPVVATPLPDLRLLGEHVYLANGATEFVEILRSLHKSETPERRQTRIELAQRNSWKARFTKFEELLWAKLGGIGPAGD